MRFASIAVVVVLLGVAWALPIAAQDNAGIGADEALLVEEDDGGRYWHRDDTLGEQAPRYPRNVVLAGVSGCVSIGFVILPDGSTSGYQLLQGKTSLFSGRSHKAAISQFAKATVDMLENGRYLPGTENPDRLRGFASTYASFTMDQIGGSEWREGCRIRNLGQFMRSRAASPPDNK